MCSISRIGELWGLQVPDIYKEIAQCGLPQGQLVLESF